MPPKVTPVATRFWSKVDTSGECWLWTGATNGRYGKIGRGGRGVSPASVHRVAYEMAYGPIPEGFAVCHRCDVPLCVRPDHLFLGTTSDNMQDAARKGRMPTGNQHPLRLRPERAATGDRNGSRTHPERLPRGEANTQSKLTPDLVRAMRQRYADGGISYARLAADFGVTTMTAFKVIKRKTWQHVD